MSLEGLRAWIAEVERKLGKRTRVFLALAVIAIGLGGAAIYLAIDARNSSVSESDVQALQEKLEARIDELASGGTATPPIETTPETEPSTPTPDESGSGGQGGSSGGGSGGSPGGGGGAQGGGASGAAGSPKLQELLEEAKRRAKENE